MKNAKIFIVSGTTASGKTTVTEKFLEKTTLPFARIITCTTREKREGEQDGIDYHFFTRDEFQEKINQGFFLEWAEVHENLYGTPLDQVEKELANNNSIILVIDVQGALAVKAKRPDAVLIFIKAENLEQIKSRITKRHGGIPEDLDVRLASAEKELQLAGQYDYQIVNTENKIDAAVQELDTIITSELA